MKGAVVAELIGDDGINWDDFSVDGGEPAPVIEGHSPQAAAPAFEADTAVEIPESQPEETAPEEGRPRDEQGRFVARERAEEPAAEAGQRLFAGKYRSAEELEAAHAHLEQRLGMQGNELGQLREELRQWQEQQQQILSRPRTTFDLDELYDEDPGQAADAALQAQDQAGYQRILDQWRRDDPAGVRQYQAVQQARYDAYMAQQQVQELRQAQQEQAYGAAMESAWHRLRQEIPDLDGRADAMREEAVEASRLAGRDVYAEDMESGDPNRVYWALRTLAHAAAPRLAGHQAAQSQEIARAHAAESQRAAAEAVVTSATATAPEPVQRPQTYDERFSEEILAARKPLEDGFQVGNY